jgi:hypothetical protein
MSSNDMHIFCFPRHELSLIRGNHDYISAPSHTAMSEEEKEGYK